MMTIARKRLDEAADGPASTGAGVWERIVRCASDWAQAEGVSLRDAVVLLPFAQLLPHARRAFAAAGGWPPRIETTRTLAASLGPPSPAAPSAPSLDAAIDALHVRQMLAAEPWGEQWQRRDPLGFARAAARLVATAHAIVAALSRVHPQARDAWWAAARDALRPAAGPGARETSLARLALEWAALAPPAPTDRLFGRVPSAWIAVEAGGADPFIATLFGAARVPCLVVDADASVDHPFAAVHNRAAPSLAVCDSFEEEAEAAAAQVLEHLRLGERPVVLIAQDRLLVRRVRALLERAATVLLDETGWTLSTTRAAAQLMSLLLVARGGATADQLFDWLKGGTRWQREAPAAVAAIEAASRKHGAWRMHAIAALRLGDAAAAGVRDEVLAVLEPLRARAPQPLGDWLQSVARALDRAGVLASLRADAAGATVLAVTGIDGGAADSSLGRLAADADPISLSEFTQWVDEALEGATFRPQADVDDRGATGLEGIDVVITPLARAMLRPFAAAVLPGADDARLGRFAADDSLLLRSTRDLLGIARPEARVDAELLAFAQLLALPQVTLLHRRADGTEPLAPSPFVERLALALAESNDRLCPWRDPSLLRRLAAAPTRRAAASAPSRVPLRLSATSFEDLRACPYRFFARRMLGLAEDEELDGDLGKRDYGAWLHRVLHEFHERRQAQSAGLADDAAALRAAAAAVLAADGFDAAEFLPWSASFEAFVPRYASWLRRREARGARWTRGEAEFSVRLPDLEGTELHGRLDRIDKVIEAGTETLELIDYKTGSESRLIEQVREPLEDTQLAFYASLVGAADARPLKATYLALEARPELAEIEHKDVAASAAALVAGIAIDLRRLRGGAGLMPLGEGEACRYCEARGLCRRDHWLDDAAAEGGAA
jgi:ATP-dependent helicase/nuclease subunit B